MNQNRYWSLISQNISAYLKGQKFINDGYKLTLTKLMVTLNLLFVLILGPDIGGSVYRTIGSLFFLC